MNFDYFSTFPIQFIQTLSNYGNIKNDCFQLTFILMQMSSSSEKLECIRPLQVILNSKIHAKRHTAIQLGSEIKEKGQTTSPRYILCLCHCYTSSSPGQIIKKILLRKLQIPCHRLTFSRTMTQHEFSLVQSLTFAFVLDIQSQIQFHTSQC